IVISRASQESLRPFVRRLFIVVHPNFRHDSHLPETGIVVAFPFRGECHLGDGRAAPTAAITGIQTRVRHHVHDKGNAIALVTFTPAGAAAFLRHPVEELTNRTEALGEVVADARLTALAPQLANASYHSGRLRLLENLLAQRLSSAEV